MELEKLITQLEDYAASLSDLVASGDLNTIIYQKMLVALLDGPEFQGEVSLWGRALVDGFIDYYRHDLLENDCCNLKCLLCIPGFISF